ncbi:hypothetical protein PI124_g12249 [Phytophthora idaei]|nr:hypothetical protein PI126_g11276 [Phytophthora idaei]KAG3242931.1 hypothetical protein PI124_g12249 [Phytophthora idaei]
MHMRYALLLVVSTLLAGVSASLVSDLPSVLQPLTGKANRVSPRLLRLREERGIPVSSIENFKSLFTSLKISDETLQWWLKNGKTTDKLFTRLKLGSAKSEMFNKPQFATWVKYVDELSATRPDTKISTISTIKAYYRDEALSQMIIAAQKNPKAQQFADELQTRQLQYWLDNKKAPTDVFKLLELSKARDKLLNNPQLATWLSYVDDFNSKNPRISRISVMARYYGDETLSKMLFEAMKTPSTAISLLNFTRSKSSVG